MSDTKDRFLQGKEIVDRTGIKDFQLLEFVKSGLQPYTDTGLLLESPGFRAKTVECERIDKKLKSLAHEREIRFPSINVPKNWVPDKHNPQDVMVVNSLIHQSESKAKISRLDANIEELKAKDEALQKELALMRGSSWKDYGFPEKREPRKRVVNELLNSFYRESDALSFPELVKAIEPKLEELNDTIGEDEIATIGVSEEEPTPLTGPERQELGRLRQDRGKWENAIKAAVHVMHEITGEITRDKLKDIVYQFNLPDTTIDIIWKALREPNKGLTKGPGRPKKTK